jgi:hypothetical protein
MPNRFAFPGFCRVARNTETAKPSLTVAGPRRFLTGLPCYALFGHLRLLSMNDRHSLGNTI